MAIESIDGISDLVTPAALPPLTSAHERLSPSQAHLAESQAQAAETVEQRAAEGDPIAIDRVAEEQASLTPTRAQHLQPTYADHAPGAQEPGKGGLIDVYD